MSKQFAGVKVEEGDTVRAVYTTPDDYMDEDPTVEADITIRQFTGGGMPPAVPLARGQEPTRRPRGPRPRD